MGLEIFSFCLKFIYFLFDGSIFYLSVRDIKNRNYESTNHVLTNLKCCKVSLLNSYYYKGIFLYIFWLQLKFSPLREHNKIFFLNIWCLLNKIFVKPWHDYIINWVTNLTGPKSNTHKKSYQNFFILSFHWKFNSWKKSSDFYCQFFYLGKNTNFCFNDKTICLFFEFVLKTSHPNQHECSL